MVSRISNNRQPPTSKSPSISTPPQAQEKRSSDIPNPNEPSEGELSGGREAMTREEIAQNSPFIAEENSEKEEEEKKKEKEEKRLKYLEEYLEEKPKQNVGSLLRMFQSEFFDIHMAVEYLCKMEQRGVQDYLVNLMYSMQDVHNIDFYLPQLW